MEVITERTLPLVIKDPDHFVHESILKLQDEDENELIAYARLQKICFDQAGDAKVAKFDVCDAHSSSLLLLWELLFTSSGLLRKKFAAEAGSDYVGRVLFLELFVVNPKFRKTGIARKLFSFIKEIEASDCEFIVGVPGVISSSDVEASWLENPSTKEESQSFWKHLGFKKIAKSDFFYC